MTIEEFKAYMHYLAAKRGMQVEIDESGTTVAITLHIHRRADDIIQLADIYDLNEASTQDLFQGMKVSMQ